MKKIELEMLQALPLDIKIAKTRARVREFIRHFGIDGVYISFSGGKDSTVLADIILKDYPTIPLVFSNTGLEYPELVNFVKSYDDNYDLNIVRPKKSFKQVLEQEGYPIISKKTSRMLRDLQNPTPKNEITRKLYLSDYAIKNGKLTDKPNNQFKLAHKWRYLIDAPFKVSEKCCDIMKKKPFKEYEKLTGRKPFIGTMAHESTMREQAYLKKGCTSFDEVTGACTPLGFWTEQDIFQYIQMFNLEIAPPYGDIVRNEETGLLETTGEKRTGCIFCPLGIQLEKGQNRYQRLELTHPKLHSYCMDTLGFKEVCETIGVSYKNEIEPVSY